MDTDYVLAHAVAFSCNQTSLFLAELSPMVGSWH